MILFFHQAALGDFVLTFPLLRALQADAPVTVISSWSRAMLAQRAIRGVTPMSIELFEFTRLHAPGGPTALSPAVRELFDQASMIVSFVARASDPWASNAQRLAPDARVLCVLPRPEHGVAWKGHIVDWHRQQLAEQGVELVPMPPPKRQVLTGPIVVHPGSGGHAKCWPAHAYEHLITILREEGRDVRPILGEAEADRWQATDVARWREGLGAQVVLDVLALHDVLGQASLYVGNDSGPTHLAAQLGCPTIALFGPTDPRHWAPRGVHVTVLAPPRPRPMDWLDLDRVRSAIAQRLLT